MAEIITIEQTFRRRLESMTVLAERGGYAPLVQIDLEGTGPLAATVNLTPEQARALGDALIDAAESI